jgi:hypothetical protein
MEAGVSTDKKKLVAKLKAQAEAEVKRLQAHGWKKADFAKALRGLLEPKGVQR